MAASRASARRQPKRRRGRAGARAGIACCVPPLRCYLLECEVDYSSGPARVKRGPGPVV